MKRHTMVLLSAAVACLLGPTTGSTAQEWEACGVEGDSCELDGVGILRYGVDDRWYYAVGTDEHSCTTAILGDPAPGEKKACYRWNNGDERAARQSAEDQEYVARLEDELSALRERGDRRRPRRDLRDSYEEDELPHDLERPRN